MKLWFILKGTLYGTDMHCFMDARAVRMAVYDADNMKIDFLRPFEIDSCTVYESRKAAEFHERGKDYG